jgi:hypothetical protein
MKNESTGEDNLAEVKPIPHILSNLKTARYAKFS